MTKHMAKETQFIGRYSPLSGVSGGDLPRAGGKIEIVHGHEADPEAQPEGPGQSPAASATVGRKRRRVAINARTDLLEYEHQRGRLSPQAYAAGRYIDAVLEASNGRRGGVEFGERSRLAVSAYSLQQALAARMDAAREAARLKDAMAREIGRESARVASLVIGEGLSFRDIARMEAMTRGKAKEGAPLRARPDRVESRDRTGLAQNPRVGACPPPKTASHFSGTCSSGKRRDCERAARRIAGLFRDGLEELAAVWEEKGRPV